MINQGSPVNCRFTMCRVTDIKVFASDGNKIKRAG